jgi:hypothetical protein
MQTYLPLLVLIVIAGLALALSAVAYLVAKARGMDGASVAKFWLGTFSLLCLLASAALWAQVWMTRR